MKVQRILERKGHEVITVKATETLAEALHRLVEHGIGSVMVMDGDDILGILTERDILRLVDRDPSALPTTPVDQAMTRDLIVAVLDDEVSYLMEVMTRNRIRHLPVVVEGKLRGIVSIGDVVNAIRRDAESENRYLRDYVQGRVR